MSILPSQWDDPLSIIPNRPVNLTRSTAYNKKAESEIISVTKQTNSV